MRRKPPFRRVDRTGQTDPKRSLAQPATSGADAAYLPVTIPVGPAPETVRMNNNSYRCGPQSAPRRR